MKTYNEIVDDLETLEKKEVTDVSGLDTRVTALENQPIVEIHNHLCRISGSGFLIYFNITTSSNTPLTKDSLIQLLSVNDAYIPCSGGDTQSSTSIPVAFQIYERGLYLRYKNSSGNIVSGREISASSFEDNYTFTDVVI